MAQIIVNTSSQNGRINDFGGTQTAFVNETAGTTVDASSSSYLSQNQGFWFFDTTTATLQGVDPLFNPANITSLVVQWWPNSFSAPSQNTGWAVYYSPTGVNGSTLTTADFNIFGSLQGYISSWTTGQYNQFTITGTSINNGITNVEMQASPASVTTDTVRFDNVATTNAHPAQLIINYTVPASSKRLASQGVG